METKTSCQIEVRIPRKPEFVRFARKAVCMLAAELDFTYDRIKDIELAVGEACSNSVKHVDMEECDEIVLRLSIEPQQLAVEVIDRGQGFDAAQVEQRQEWDEESCGRMGFLVIRGVTDKVEIISDAATGTCVRMVWYRSGQ